MKDSSKINSRGTMPDLQGAAASLEVWDFRLYVAGQSPMSIAAFKNLKRICEEHLTGRYRIQVIDLTLHPKLAQDDQILAIPSVVRRFPTPTRKIVGVLSDTKRAMIELQLLAESDDRRMDGHSSSPES